MYHPWTTITKSTPTDFTIHLSVIISNETPRWFIDSMTTNNKMFLMLLNTYHWKTLRGSNDRRSCHVWQ